MERYWKWQESKLDYYLNSAINFNVTTVHQAFGDSSDKNCSPSITTSTSSPPITNICLWSSASALIQHHKSTSSWVGGPHLFCHLEIYRRWYLAHKSMSLADSTRCLSLRAVAWMTSNGLLLAIASTSIWKLPESDRNSILCSRLFRTLALCAIMSHRAQNEHSRHCSPSGRRCLSLGSRKCPHLYLLVGGGRLWRFLRVPEGICSILIRNTPARSLYLGSLRKSLSFARV